MMGWQPIETAPRDGTPILCYNPVVGVYNSGFTTKWPNSCEAYEGFPCGFWYLGITGDPFGAWDCQPTHWQHQPEPPK